MLLRVLAIVLVAAFAVSAQQEPPPIRASSPDQKSYAVAEGGKIDLFDGATQKLLWRYQGTKGKVTALAFSPDGRRLAASGDDKQLRLIDAPTGKELVRLISDGAAEKITFSPDGKLLIVKQSNQKERKWEVATGKLLE